MPRTIRILIADDHQLIRRGVRSLLEGRDGWEIVTEAQDGVEAVREAGRTRPDVVILDFSMPGLNGAEAAHRILGSHPGTGIIVLTMHDSDRIVLELVRAGARGVVLKSEADRELVAAVEAVADGRHYFNSRITELVLAGYLNPRGSFPEAGPEAGPEGEPGAAGMRTAAGPTVREREVIRMLADGMTSKEVAAGLKISIRTVETHRININRKMGFGSLADLVRYAVHHGLVADW